MLKSGASDDALVLTLVLGLADILALILVLGLADTLALGLALTLALGDTDGDAAIVFSYKKSKGERVIFRPPLF